MAVRFSADGQDFTRTLTLGAQTAFTICCWVNVVDRNNYSSLWSLDNGTGDMELLQTDVDGTTLMYYPDYDAGDVLSLTAGTWTFVAIVGTTAGNARTAYHRTASASSLTQVSLGSATSTTMTTLRLGESPFGAEWLNGRLAAVKGFIGVSLTAAEVLAESMQHVPARSANLAFWYPFLRNETTDYSGNARTLSGGSGTATEDGPPIPWLTVAPRLILPSAVSGSTQNADATLTATGTVTADGASTKPAGASPTATATATATAASTKPVAASVAATATVTATASVGKPISATLTGTVTLTADATVGTAPVTVDATSTTTATVTTAAAGTKPVDTTSIVTTTTTAAAVASKPADTSSAATLAVTAASSATKPATTTTTTAATVTASAASAKPASATLTASATITASAVVGSAPVQADATFNAAATVTAAGALTRNAAGASNITSVVTASAAVVKPIGATLPITIIASPSGTRTLTAAATVSAAASVVAAGTIPQPIVFGSMEPTARSTAHMQPTVRDTTVIDPLARNTTEMQSLNRTIAEMGG